MKKLSLFVAILLVIGLASFVYAENSSTGMSGRYFGEDQVWIEAYNNSGSDISSNYVVILETTAANITSGSTLGAYITTTTSTGSALAIGVTDETIENGTSGRVCVRGPHKVRMISLGGATTYYSAGATVGTCETAGYANILKTSADTRLSTIGCLLSTTAVQQSSEGLKSGENDDGVLYWIYVRPAGQ